MGDGTRISRADASALSRRSFLGASGLVGASALIGRRGGSLAGSPATVDVDVRADVAVVGGGVAGLVAARALRRAGADVLVLEGGTEPGGRLADGAAPALGSLTASSGHNALLGLADELGIGYRADAGGDVIVAAGRERRVVPTGTLLGDPAVDREVGVALQRLNLMAAEVDPVAAGAADNAGERDGMSVGAWTAENLGSAGARDAFTMLSRIVWAAEPAEVSLLHALATVAGAGGVGPLVNAMWASGWRGPKLLPAGGNTSGDASCKASPYQAAPFVSVRNGDAVERVAIDGGAAALVGRLSEEIGAGLRLGAAVHRVVQDDGGVTVESRGLKVRVAQVVMALPPAALGRVVFEPGLGGDQAAVAKASPGDVVTVVCTYRVALLGPEPTTGRAVGHGLLTVGESVTVDGVPVVVAHACGAAARSWSGLAADERRRRALALLATWFGPPAGDPGSYSEHDWRDGAFGGRGWGLVAPPGTAVSLSRALGEPVGRVHFAGAERSPEWAGWLEGAIRSGEHAARAAASAAGVIPRVEVPAL